ncbi:alpha/beta hydrolase family protein [Streptomyces sp. NBC_01498]|uniref:alpha/beta hydrolase n=1 Tax=Streptomyces sp. NBC_01498 TaxID=2975870 RepID=UPI002E7C393A|nr:alpha/beta hydrolase [Streptomyces sp. NBC_01498]WTL26064.1 alpha/beta hydrolase family protein [Streptomyces sp. NBC_01498]
MRGSGGGLGGLTWTQLRDVGCAGLEDAADGWGRASNRADAARDRIDKQLLAGLTATQEGEAARAAVGRLRALSRNFQYIYTECGLVRTTLNSLAQDLRGSQRRLRDALDDAAALRFTVGPDGSVSYPEAGEDPLTKQKLRGGTASGQAYPVSAPPPGLTGPNPLAAKAQAVADRIARAVSEAAETDTRYARTLRNLTARDGLTVTGAMWADTSADATAVRALTADYLRDAIPRDGTAAERLAWWRGLTAEQREEYLAVHPDLIGNLDGIPATVRDAANRDNLALLMGRLEGLDDDRSRTMLAGLRSIDEQLRAGGHPPMFLLGIGDEGNGRAIVSYGNPDTARNVSAYVPGLGTGLDAGFAEDDLRRARDTMVGALEYDTSTASIVWLGYDAPQLSVDDITGNTDVMFTGHAEAGASAYREFMAGIEATNEHENPHLTAVGHSYGSLTVGQAAQHDGGIPGVDDIVLVGSPGTGANSAEELGVGRGHVYVGAAENDPVTRMPAKAEAQGLGMGALSGASVGAALGGPVGAAAGAAGGAVMAFVAQDAQTAKSEIWFGTDPAHEDFGARRFRVDDGPHPVLEMGGVRAHSNYFDPGKDEESADNIALIIAGQGRLVTGQERR